MEETVLCEKCRRRISKTKITNHRCKSKEERQITCPDCARTFSRRFNYDQHSECPGLTDHQRKERKANTRRWKLASLAKTRGKPIGECSKDDVSKEEGIQASGKVDVNKVMKDENSSIGSSTVNSIKNFLIRKGAIPPSPDQPLDLTINRNVRQ